MENPPLIRSRDHDELEGSTVQRPFIPGPGLSAAVGSTASMPQTTPETVSQANSLKVVDDAKTVVRKSDSGSIDNAVAPTGNPTPAAVASVLLGTRLNHFLLEEMIGGGGMGAVFRARDDRLDRIVAIKVIPFVGDDLDLQRRFRNEAQNAARLDHPYIARVFDVGQFEQWHYIVFEHVEGINLRDMVARDGVLSIDDAVYYTRQISEAIEHANGRGIVHRDIKPSNVLVGVDGNVKVVDMGLARSQQIEVSGDMTASGVTLGTFDYISPEQARDPRDADVRSDIYSLGCTLYYLLTASPPYPGGTMLQKLLSHGNAPPPDPRGLRPEVSDNLTAIIHKMLAKDPAARYPRAIDVVADLRELATREGLLRAQSRGTLTIASSDPLPQFMSRHLPWMVAAALILCVAGWLQVSAEVNRDQFAILRPPSGVLQNQPSGSELSPATPANDTVKTTANGPLLAATGAATTRNGSPDDVATAPPSISIGAPAPASPAAAVRTDLNPSQPAIAIQRIVIGDSPTDPAARTAATLADALQLATELKVNTIEIAVPVITSAPIIIDRDGLTIRSLIGGSEIRFSTGETQAMQPVAMIDVGAHRISLEDLHLSWSVRSTTIDGGTLFRIASDNHRVLLANSTITVENRTDRDEVYAFEIADSERGSIPIASAVVPNSTSSSSPGIQPASGVAGAPPMVAIELVNVAARGEMTLIHLVAPVQLQFVWQNGLLAVSRRMLEAAGASVRPPLGSNQIQISLDQVTVWAVEGLARMRMGQSRAYPLMIDRSCRRSAFHCDADASLVEFDGLDSEITDPGQFVQLRGEDNAYDFDPARDASILQLSQWNNRSQTYYHTDILAPERPSWFSDRSRQWVVRWTKPVPLPETTPASRLTSKDFLQDGPLVPGFDRNRLPLFPMRPLTDASI